MSVASKAPEPAGTSSPDVLAQNLSWLLSQASHALSTEMTAALEGIGLLPRGHRVPATALTGERTQTELAHLVGLDKTTMVVTLDELERTGLAERRPSPGDRRVRVVAVTDAGRREGRRGRRGRRARPARGAGRAARGPRARPSWKAWPTCSAGRSRRRARGPCAGGVDAPARAGPAHRRSILISTKCRDLRSSTTG